MIKLIIRMVILVVGIAIGVVWAEVDGYYANSKEDIEWEATIEDSGHACIEKTMGGSTITNFVLIYEQEKGSEICHGKLVEARRRWEIKSDSD